MEILEKGVPCKHPGCMNHVTHPCEVCGRIAAGSKAMRKKVYHGSNVYFEDFSNDYICTENSIDQYGSGFYFYDTPDRTSRHGDLIMVTEITVRKALEINSTNKFYFNFHQIEELILKSPDVDNCLENFGDIKYESYDHVLSRAAETYVYQDIVVSLNCIGNDFFRSSKSTHLLLKSFIEMTGFNCIYSKEFGIYVMLNKDDTRIIEITSLEDLE